MEEKQENIKKENHTVHSQHENSSPSQPKERPKKSSLDPEEQKKADDTENFLDTEDNKRPHNNAEEKRKKEESIEENVSDNVDNSNPMENFQKEFTEKLDYGHSQKSFDYTKDQNIIEAQRKYEEAVNQKRGFFQQEDINSPDSELISRINYERTNDISKIKNRGIDLSELYEESARGGAAESAFVNEFGLSKKDIENLMSTRGLCQPSNLSYSVSKYGKEAARIITGYSTDMTFAGTDTGQGMRMTKEFASPVMFIVSDVALRSVTKAMEKDLANRLNRQAKDYNVFGKDFVFIDKSDMGVDCHELLVLENELRKKLENVGIENLRGSGIEIQNKIRVFLRRNKKNLTTQEQGALKMLMSIEKTRTLNDAVSKGRMEFRRDLLIRSFRFIQQTDAGEGFVLTYNIINRTQKSIRYAARSIRFTLKAAQLIGKTTALASAKAALKLVRSRIGQQVLPESALHTAGQIQDSVRKVFTERNLPNRNVPNNRIHKIRQSLQRRSTKIRAFRKDPFSLKKKRRELLRKLQKTKIGKTAKGIITPFSVTKRAVGYALSTLMSIASAVISMLMAAIGSALLLFFVVVIVIVIITSIFSFFDFSSHDENIQEAAIEQIRKCYQEQNNQIQSFYSRYRNVTINYQVKKDEDVYAENPMMTEVSGNTNAAEILSMAVVYFEFDLDEADVEDVKDYVRKLYNGSHQYYVSETPVYQTDEDGNKIQIATDANITLTTYYFNSIFDCSLAESSYSGTASFGSDMSGGEVAEQMFNYFVSAGWSEEAACAAIGNAAQESGGTLISGINPSIVGGGGRGVFGFTYSPDSHSADTGMGLVRYANSIGKDWTDLETQLQYFILCMNGTWGSMWNINSFTAKQFKNAGYNVPTVTFQQFTQLTDVEDATMAFLCSYENCGIANARWETRIRESQKAYQLYANKS